MDIRRDVRKSASAGCGVINIRPAAALYVEGKVFRQCDRHQVSLRVVVLVTVLGGRSSATFGHCTLPLLAPWCQTETRIQDTSIRLQSDYRRCAAIVTSYSVRDGRPPRLPPRQGNGDPHDVLGRCSCASTHIYAPEGSKTYPGGKLTGFKASSAEPRSVLAFFQCLGGLPSVSESGEAWHERRPYAPQARRT
jgi:hypothetical protein